MQAFKEWQEAPKYQELAKKKGRSYKIYVEIMDTGVVCVDESAGMSPDDELKTPSGNPRRQATRG